MKEVSCKVIAPILKHAARQRVPLEELGRGTPYTPSQLQDAKERIHFDEFIQIMSNARRLWTEEEIVDIGKQIMASPMMLPLTLAARLVFSAKDFYFYVNKGTGEGGGGMLFTNMKPACRSTGRNTLEIDLLTEEGYPLCREFYLLALGSFIVLPSLVGLPHSKVRMEDLPRGVRYHVEYPEGGGVLRAAGSFLTRPFTAHTVAKQMMAANEALEQRYQDLERARLALAKQATKLRTANEIAQTVHGDLDLDRSLTAVTRALIAEADFAHARVELNLELDGLLIHRSCESGGVPQEDEPRPLRRDLVGRDGHSLGTVTVHAKPRADVSERNDLLSFIVPSIAMALDNAISYLVVEEYRKGLERRVEERTAELSQARDELAGTVKDLEEAREARERIFANINHDIRSPLSLILLAVAEARRAGALTPAAEKTLSGIEHGARRVLRMVDELLILAEGREGEVRLSTAVVDLTKMVAAVGEAWQPAAQAAELELAHSEQPLIAVRADPNAVERILANLVSNAIKFTPKGGKVQLRLTTGESGLARIDVQDNGTGIDDELKKRLFGRFERGNLAKRSAIGGSGLGLSLVKELAEAHGGSVTILDAPGGGAIFRVELPRCEPDIVSGTAANGAAPAAGGAKLRPQDYGVVVGESQQVEIYEPSGKTARATVLLAEDDPNLREHTARLLAEDYRVIAAPDGLAAFEQARQHSPDLLITDVAMPRMDGFELTRQFRAMPNNRLAPVLVLTTFGGVADKLSGFDAGAVDYIHKPFEPAELRARVRSQLMLRSLALQLLETEKLAALGTLSAGLAHEIRNPANGIINAVAPLRELLPPEAVSPETPAGQLLDIVEHCSQQVAAMSRQLLGFKRGVDPKRQPVPITPLIARVCTTLSPSLEGVQVREQLDYKGTIHCAEPLIAQVLTNLVQNGAHAAGKGGWVEIRTGAEKDRIFVEIRDSGPGVPEDLKERIFEPFFTTKPAGSGTGLGLSTARDIALRHGGSLEVRSAAGRSVFRLEIPSPS